MASLVVILTAAIAIVATWTSVGLLRRRMWRLSNLEAVGFHDPKWPLVFGVTLLTAVAGLVVGWWFEPAGILAIATIKVLYFTMLIAYRKSHSKRDNDMATLLMTAHSIAALASIVLLLT